MHFLSGTWTETKQEKKNNKGLKKAFNFLNGQFRLFSCFFYTFVAVLFGNIMTGLLGLLNRHTLTVLLGHLRFNILDTDVLEFLCTYVYTGIGEEL